jgi:hypothetical protein
MRLTQIILTISPAGDGSLLVGHRLPVMKKKGDEHRTHQPDAHQSLTGKVNAVPYKQLPEGSKTSKKRIHRSVGIAEKVEMPNTYLIIYK